MPFFRIVSRFLSGLLFAGLAVAAHAESLPSAFTTALQQAGIPLDHVAVVVQPLDADEPLISHNADAALNPASVMKLVTSFAALNQLGPDYVWKTDVWAEGPIRNGVLEGDLVIKGYGDPTLTLERMWLLQRELRARGVRHIRGNLVLDLSDFELPVSDPGEFDGEPLALYNAVPGALVANFNATTLRLKPDGNVIGIEPDVALPGVAIRSDIALTESAACNGWKDALAPSIPDPERRELVVGGRYPRGCGEQALSLNLFEPAVTFDFLFRGLWAETGGTLGGQTVPGMAPETPPLLRFESLPLTDALIRLNKYSNNLMARNLFLTLGTEAYGPPATPDKGARAVREDLAQRGISTRKLVLENGAGLSRIERISAGALNQLLRAAYRSPLFAEFESALPIAATDGTLKRRFKGSTLTGSAHLKTGTLRDVSALAGYLDTMSGRRVSFVMLVNHAKANRSEAAQRALLEWVQSEMSLDSGARDDVR
ncbi:D-alanyl-D-alanine carboxypeptidase/D-alanyl-D-alanine-endopeptidase [Thiobacillus sp. 0-1251]|uniref:D-alanyl-D-alanine carboxypeptidase/D-alanyl-D-alanine endopeptidase n=1 Tax=Thiobacillus sp. 0-1251 TaxID=1895858 RepID=UPI00095D8F12|nr:D-alanyl-D-alanine carboxypeptidase/D-alanyl-D-alanine-endopeptidase [Thiobacillus sp. 0-1251]OJY55056.1 MAG: D-alanyl-D-alanine carboxypeptidase/D-alanyl-D-alanine-endopeptidase [Thiobacillus sp. 0-1251]